MRGRLRASAPQWWRRALRVRNPHVSAGVVRPAQLWAALQARGLEEQLPSQGRFAWRLSADRDRGALPRHTSLRGRRGLPGCPPVSDAG